MGDKGSGLAMMRLWEAAHPGDKGVTRKGGLKFVLKFLA